MSIEINAHETASAPIAAGGEVSSFDAAAAPSAVTAATAASADFVRAISDFLDTDPTDLLRELGYYDREDKR